MGTMTCTQAALVRRFFTNTSLTRLGDVRRYPSRISMSNIAENEIVLKASRWRFFATTASASLSVGLLIYALTEWLNIPYGWAVFLVVIRALFWAATVEIRNLDVRINANSFTGPGMLFTSKSRTLLLHNIGSENIFELLGVFSVEDASGNEIIGHYTYYSREDRRVLREFIGRLRYYNVAKING